MTKYLSLDYVKGQFFEYSKDELPGYEKHTSSKGNVTYRNYFLKGVRGVFKGVKFEDGNFGEQVRVGLEDNGTVYVLSLGTSNTNGYEDGFFIPLLQFLPGMKIGETYLISPYRFTPKDSKYEKRGISIKDENDQPVERVLSQAYYKNKELIEGDIPALTFEQDRKEKWFVDPVSQKARDKYIDTVIEGLEKTHPADFGGGIQGYNVTSADLATGAQRTAPMPSEEVPTATKANPKTSAKVEEPASSEVDDSDLPF